MPTLNEASSGFPYALFELVGPEARHLTNQLIPISEFTPCNMEDSIRNTQDAHELIRLIAKF